MLLYFFYLSGGCMGFSVKQKGDFKKALGFMKNTIKEIHDTTRLHRYGIQGVQALSMATPKDSGETAKSWRYEVIEEPDRMIVRFYNTNMADNVSVAILLQYGHGTGTGGYVEGIDYINPTLRPIFQKLADEAWKEVIKV